MGLLHTTGKFLRAARDGNLARVREYLDKGYVRIDDMSVVNGLTALHMAARSGHLEIVDELLARKAPLESLTALKNTPMAIAVIVKNFVVALRLLEAGANPNVFMTERVGESDYRGTLLHGGVLGNDLLFCQRLLERGVPVDERDKNDRTPLYLAASHKNLPLVDLLLEHGADPGLALFAARACGDTLIYERIRTAIEGKNKSTEETPPEAWKILDPDSIAHIRVYKTLARQVTEIFNFSARERLIISENTKTGAESIAPPENFDALSAEALTAAYEAFTARGGRTENPLTFRKSVLKKNP